MADRFRGPRKDKVWAFIGGSTHSLTTGVTQVGGSVSSSENVTMLRMLGEYVVAPVATPTALDQCEITVAIGKFSTDAFTLGASAMPDPFDEPEYPWLYWASHKFFMGTTDTDPSSAAASVRRSFDIRSMRKLKVRETFGVVIQYTDIAGAPPMTLALAQTRCLFAE